MMRVIASLFLVVSSASFVPSDAARALSPEEQARLWGCCASSVVWWRSVTFERVTRSAGRSASPEGMVWIPGGEFTMGSSDASARPDEKPPHRVRVGAFWMDATEVTNEQFAAFVGATGYVTVAERPVIWEEIRKQLPPGTPKPADEALQPGSLVFTPPERHTKTRSHRETATRLTAPKPFKAESAHRESPLTG